MHIKDDVERFKSRLVDTLQQIQYNNNLDTIRIDKLVEYIKNTD